MKKRNVLALISGLLLLTLVVGCTGKPNNSDDNAAQIAQPEWETQLYEDQYLSYEIPSNWIKNKESSNDEIPASLFHEDGTQSNNPSNVVVAIINLDSPGDLDYSDPAIQEEFHEFLISPVGLPQKEAKDGEYAAEQIGDLWVYSLAFDRDLGDGTVVRQTVYYPMGLDRTIEVCATDFKDNATPAVNEVAKNICATLKVL